MKWKDVNVWQYQQIENVLSKKDGDTELDLAVKTLAILTNRTEGQIDSLSLAELTKQLKIIDFVSLDKPKPKNANIINVNGKRYRCVYDIKNMPYSRYVETKYFGSDTTANLHRIAASMVVPMKKTWLGWKLDKYDAAKHEEYAQDLLSAPFEQIYGSVIFFCQVYAHSIMNLKDYFKAKMIKLGMSEDQSEKVLKDLCDNLDGFTKLH